MLPPTAAHHLLLGLPGDPPGPRALVLTSGNLASEPIVIDDAEALARLGGIADAWLRHGRRIHVPCDDAVVRVVAGEELPVRRSRGYAPLPVALPVEVRPVLAVGGDLKNTFCLATGRYAWLSAHVGDMDDLATQQAFERSAHHLAALVDVEPQALVADRHPSYRSAQWAARRAASQRMPLQRVQHHHAHVAAVMAEHGLDGDQPVIGIAFDGTGYGDDGAVWGGEALIADYDGFERFAHLSYVPLPGGDVAVRRPYRMALAHLSTAGLAWQEGLPCVAACPPEERRVLAHQVRTGLATVPTSSAGRLFDAVASLAGVCQRVDFEAQAAMALEASAVGVLGRGTGGAALRAAGNALVTTGAASGGAAPSAGYPLPLVPEAEEGPGGLVWDCGELVRAVVADVGTGVTAAVIAARFHRGLADAVVAVAERARSRFGLEVVALSGGVFCNTVLLALTSAGLAGAGFTVLRHRRVPPNDGGLGLGQVVVGARLVVGA
jgi:hydrogenase maturation protein HypF